ncbi:GGDEF domain-containing protein [Pararhodospirillum photometricum]|nr:GGDEF domain-containing protein [Pararhodospirillum photometricum]
MIRSLPDDLQTDIPSLSLRTMTVEIKRLRALVQSLEQHNSDLEIALTTAVEHGDAIEIELRATNDRLRTEVRERVVAERRLACVLEAVSQQKQDLEVLVQTITQHSDDIDLQWLTRYTEVEALTRLDGLTGIANRRMFDRMLEKEWSRALRARQSLGLLICDLDHFKAYNDRYGHLAGDEVLVAFAGILRDACRRAPDLPARVGGEEFAILMPDTPLDGVCQVADNVRLALRSQGLVHAGSPAGVVGVSIGVASLVPLEADAPSTLYSMADRRLYRAKTEGRDQVCAS